METNSTSAICTVNGDCGTGVVIAPTVRDPNASVGSGGADVGYTGPTIAEIIDALAGVIEFSHLAQSLRTRIDIINSLEAGFNELSTQVVTDNSVMAQQLIGLRADLTDAVAYVNNQTTIELNERQALVTSINQMVASLGDGISAALQEESIVRAEQTGALFAEKTIKTDLAGNVAGYGLSSYADPSEAVSDFRVASDRFSIAPPAYVSPTPPPAEQMHDGKVWVDTSQGSEAAVTKWWSSATASWSLTPVTAAQPFIYLTTPTTLPDGTVVDPGLYVNSANITKLRSDQIDTRGLTIKDGAGNIIFGSGTGLDWDKINGTNKPEDGATRNVFRGNWGNAITYTYGDIVLDGGNGWRAISTHTSSGTNKPPASGTGNTWWATYTVKGDAGAPGTDSLTIICPNGSHTLPATSGGAVSSYIGSGTTIQVIDGVTALTAVASITANGQFVIGTPTVTGDASITVGGRTYSGTTATVAQHNTMSSTGDVCVITYPITVRRSNGVVVNLSVQQTLTKSRAGAQGAKGDTGKGISTITNTYQASNSGTVVPGGTWTASIPALSNSAMFLWNKEVITYTDNTTQTNHYMIGQKGVDGVNGVSLDSVLEQYQAGNSATVAPTGSWGTSIPALTDTNKFLWNKETFVYSDGTQDVFIKMIGQKGDKGDPGKGISTVDNTYQASSSGTTVPTGTWSTTIPSLTDTNKFLWNREIITFSDSTNTTNYYMIGQKGQDGASGKGVSSITEQYQVGSSGTTAPTGTWSTSIPALTDTNKYLWNKETYSYTDGTTSIFYKLIGQKGDKGDPGKGISSVNNTYQSGTSGTTAPTETWSSSIPTLSDTYKYLWNKEVITFTDGTTTTNYYMIGQKGQDGSSGKGISSITEQYQAGSSGTTSPTGTWSSSIPTLTDTNKYLWNKETYNYTDGTSSVFYKLIGQKGDVGPAGPTVVLLTNRTPSFTSTDGVLDTGQDPITFTAVVDGVDSPNYVWTVGGTQSTLTFGNVPSITITAAQFGVATSAIVTCTVSDLSDQVAVHRLNKSTAEAGATVGATLGHVTVVSTLFTTEFANTTGWTRLSGGGEWVSTSDSGAVGGNALQLGNSAGDDQVWLGRTSLTAIPFVSTKLYRIRTRVYAAPGTAGQFFFGLEAFKSDGTTVISKTGAEFTGASARTSAPMHWVGASALVLPTGEWVEIEAFVTGHGGAGSGELSNNPATPVTMRTNTAYISPAFAANWPGMAGRVLVDYCIVEEVTYTPANTQGKITKANASTWIADAAIGNAHIQSAAIDTLKVAGNAITAAASAVVDINTGTDLVMDSSSAVYYAPANTFITLLVNVTGRTGSVTGSAFNLRRLILRWGFSANPSSHVDLLDTGFSPWIGDFFSMSALVTIPANEFRNFSIRLENPSQNTVSLTANINFFAAKR